MRFVVDVHFPPSLVQTLCNAGVDACHGTAEGSASASNAETLGRARYESPPPHSLGYARRDRTYPGRAQAPRWRTNARWTSAGPRRSQNKLSLTFGPCARMADGLCAVLDDEATALAEHSDDAPRLGRAAVGTLDLVVPAEARVPIPQQLRHPTQPVRQPVE